MRPVFIVAVAVVATIAGYLFVYQPHVHFGVKLIDLWLRVKFYQCGVYRGGVFNRGCFPVNTIAPESDGTQDGIVIKNLFVPYIFNNTSHNVTVRHYAKNDTKKAPLLLFIHGGGYVVGSVGIYDKMLKNIIERTGIQVMSLDYRKAPEYPFPLAIYDIATVWDWLNHLDKNKDPLLTTIDTSKIALGGDSAGGGLTISSTFMIRDKHIPLYQGEELHKEYEWHLDLDYQILIYPSVQEANTTSKHDRNNMYILSQRSMDFFGDSYVMEIRKTATEETLKNPHFLFPLRAASFANLPDALLITATWDPLHDEGVMYGEKLQQAGVDVVHRNFDSVHGFANFAFLKESIESWDLMVDELKKQGFVTNK
jgi:acetyl esterase